MRNKDMKPGCLVTVRENDSLNVSIKLASSIALWPTLFVNADNEVEAYVQPRLFNQTKDGRLKFRSIGWIETGDVGLVLAVKKLVKNNAVYLVCKNVAGWCFDTSLEIIR